MNNKLEHSQPPKAQKSALLAVSGGVDSICLLHLLTSALKDQQIKKSHQPLEDHILNFIKFNKLQKLELAYIDHSQRKDTKNDILAIKNTLSNFGSNIPLHIIKLNLEPNCSEEKARSARYKALEEIRSKRKLDHIITAHHADDQIETALINLTRGTGPKGLSSLRHHQDGIWRPFLWQNNSSQSTLQNNFHIFKKDLIEYAKIHKLNWNEDSTNTSSIFLRNRVRKKLNNSKQSLKLSLLYIIERSNNVSKESEELLFKLNQSLQKEDDTYSKDFFKQLPQEVQKSFLHLKLSQIGYDVNKKSVNLALDFILNKNKGKKIQLKGCEIHIVQKDSFAFAPAPKK
jgi:tRNA(Ile)-lysidine synthase